MPPNITDPPVSSQENEDLAPKSSTVELENNVTQETEQPRRNPNRSIKEYNLRTFLTSLNLLAHILIGSVTGIAMIFAFRNGMPLIVTNLHIVLCVLGYQLLMAEAILSLSVDNGWSSHLKLVDKRRAHFILQILGSGLAIAGSFIKIRDKEEHWGTYHGKFALVALVFTSVSLVNGLASLWAYELRRFLPGNISKLTHICFGTVGFSAACVTLCIGFNKTLFRSWISDTVAYIAISFTAILVFIVILTPLASFYLKLRKVTGR